MTATEAAVSGDGLKAAIDRHAATFLEVPGMRSVAIGVYRAGEVRIGYYGELLDGGGNSPTEHTLFEIASITKTLVGCAVARAVLDGTLSLDVDIRDFLSGSFPNLEYEEVPITLRDLLTHTAGLPTHAPPSVGVILESDRPDRIQEASELGSTYGQAEFLADLHDVVLKERPGTTYRYSNPGAELVGQILENAYQKPLQAVLKELVLDKAGMSDTMLSVPESEAARVAVGYDDRDRPAPLGMTRLSGAAGAVKSTLPDMMRFVRFQLASGDEAVALAQTQLAERGDEGGIGFFWNDRRPGWHALRAPRRFVWDSKLHRADPPARHRSVHRDQQKRA